MLSQDSWTLVGSIHVLRVFFPPKRPRVLWSKRGCPMGFQERRPALNTDLPPFRSRRRRIARHRMYEGHIRSTEGGLCGL